MYINTNYVLLVSNRINAYIAVGINKINMKKKRTHISASPLYCPLSFEQQHIQLF